MKNGNNYLMYILHIGHPHTAGTVVNVIPQTAQPTNNVATTEGKLHIVHVG